MADPKAPLLGAAGTTSKDVTLEGEVFGAEVKPHLVHETVRAEMNAHRAGTRAAKSRGLVSGGRSKPWRQKGTARPRRHDPRAPLDRRWRRVRADPAELRRQGEPEGLPFGSPRCALAARERERSAFSTAPVSRSRRHEDRRLICSANGASSSRSSSSRPTSPTSQSRSGTSRRSLVTSRPGSRSPRVVWAKSLLVTEARPRARESEGEVPDEPPSERRSCSRRWSRKRATPDRASNKYSFRIHRTHTRPRFARPSRSSSTSRSSR